MNDYSYLPQDLQDWLARLFTAYGSPTHESSPGKIGPGPYPFGMAAPQQDGSPIAAQPGGFSPGTMQGMDQGVPMAAMSLGAPMGFAPRDNPLDDDDDLAMMARLGGNRPVGIG